MVEVLIVYGDGINAEKELKQAFVSNGANATLVHVNEIIQDPKLIHHYQIIGFPGGFSFGDEIRSGKVLGLKLKTILGDELKNFIDQKKLIIGICNGFQTLVQLNVFEDMSNGLSDEKHFTLTENDHGEFRNFWTEVEVVSNNSPWLLNITGKFYLPVRHKEGRIYGELSKDLVALKYLNPINGSLYMTAGITDRTGQILGLMPHPEAATNSLLNPLGVENKNAEIVNSIFKNAINYFH